MHSAIDRFLNYLRVERNASELTIKSYREDLLALAGWLNESLGQSPEPGAVTPVELRAYVAALHEAGYAKSSIARRLASLRSFYRFGQREGWTTDNPAKPLRTPRKSRNLPHVLSVEEIGRLLDAPKADEPLGLRDRAILETMYSAGLRIAETVGLCDGDLDFDAGIVRVRGKGKRERLAPLGSYAAAAAGVALTRRAAATYTLALNETQKQETRHDPQTKRTRSIDLRGQVRGPATDAARASEAERGRGGSVARCVVPSGVPLGERSRRTANRRNGTTGDTLRANIAKAVAPASLTKNFNQHIDRKLQSATIQAVVRLPEIATQQHRPGGLGSMGSLRALAGVFYFA